MSAAISCLNSLSKRLSNLTVALLLLVFIDGGVGLIDLIYATDSCSVFINLIKHFLATLTDFKSSMMIFINSVSMRAIILLIAGFCGVLILVRS
jgi:hypothetical protein